MLFWCMINHLLIWYKVKFHEYALLVYCYVYSNWMIFRSEEHRELQRVWTLQDLLEWRKSQYDRSYVVCLYKHFSWVVWVFLVVVCFCSIGVLTQSPMVLIPITKLATLLGITILLFLVWVVQCQSGLSLWFACCYILIWSTRVLDLKSDIFYLAWFFTFIAKLCICLLLYL